jgi:hypothetical protein
MLLAWQRFRLNMAAPLIESSEEDQTVCHTTSVVRGCESWSSYCKFFMFVSVLIKLVLCNNSARHIFFELFMQ